MTRGILTLTLTLGAVALLAQSGAASGDSSRNGDLRRAVVAALGQDVPELKYQTAMVDLNDDGGAEVLVWVPTPEWGGTSGYPLLVFSRRNGTFELLGQFAYAWTPVGVLHTKHSGWRDMAVSVGGGGVKMHLVRWKYESGEYVGGENSPEIPRPRARWLFQHSRGDTPFGSFPKSAPN